MAIEVLQNEEISGGGKNGVSAIRSQNRESRDLERAR